MSGQTSGLSLPCSGGRLLQLPLTQGDLYRNDLNVSAELPRTSHSWYVAGACWSVSRRKGRPAQAVLARVYGQQAKGS